MKLKSVYTAVVILVLLFGCSKNALEESESCVVDLEQ